MTTPSTPDPMTRIFHIIAAQAQAVAAGDLPGPDPDRPRRLTRLAIEVDEDGDGHVLVVEVEGWEYRTALAPGEVVELLPAGCAVVLH